MNQVQNALDAIVQALQPLTPLGILVRKAADAPNTVGRLERNGVITVVYNGDAEFSSTQHLGAIHQTYQSQFVIMGRLRNLKDENGLYAVRSILYSLTVGLKLETYAQPLRAVQFKLMGEQGRKELSWDFQYVLAAPALQVSCLDGLGIEDDLPDALIAELVFDDVTVEQQESF